MPDVEVKDNDDVVYLKPEDMAQRRIQFDK